MPDEVDLERLPEAAVRVDARGTVVDRNHLAATLLESAPAGAPLEAPGFAAWLAGTGDVFRGGSGAGGPTASR